jgi:hypothetical protein
MVDTHEPDGDGMRPEPNAPAEREMEAITDKGKSFDAIVRGPLCAIPHMPHAVVRLDQHPEPPRHPLQHNLGP